MYKVKCVISKVSNMPTFTISLLIGVFHADNLIFDPV